jgi:hypothetical protein
MSIDQVKEIANAVLYEGYLLYPYRQSAIKNRQRWSIGVIYPQEYSKANGEIEPWLMQTECLIAGQEDSDPCVDVYARFLHLLTRTTTVIDERVPKAAARAESAARSMTGYHVPEAWEEGVEREISVLNLSLGELVAHPRKIAIDFPGDRIVEWSEHKEIVREQQPVSGSVSLSATYLENNIYRLHIQIENSTPETGGIVTLHNPIMLHTFASTHTLLHVQRGAFISLLDPPESLQDAAKQCQNIRTWPVLAGEEGTTDVLLSSPIILYDYPQIAPESAGPLFDGTEIDEILTLRIMTLTDEEKQEIREGDDRAREILERTENLSAEEFAKLHGTIRSLRPVGEGGQEHE